MLKNIGAKRIFVQGDTKLIIGQIKGKYFAKYPRLREYQNVVIDFLKTFKEYDLAIIPKLQNALANGLNFSSSTCKLPHPNKQYTVEVKHRPAVPHNMRNWQAFGNDK